MITSPRSRPAFAAGPFGLTCETSAPCCVFEIERLGELGVTGWMATPSQPRTTRPCCSSCGRISFAIWLGTANPIVFACGLIAVLIPTTSPARLSSGPPELPGLIAASVWMKSS